MLVMRALNNKLGFIIIVRDQYVVSVLASSSKFVELRCEEYCRCSFSNGKICVLSFLHDNVVESTDARVERLTGRQKTSLAHVRVYERSSGDVRLSKIRHVAFGADGEVIVMTS